MATPNKTAPFSGVKALMAAAGHQYEDFIFDHEGEQIIVPMRAITVFQMLRLCRRFPQLLAIFDGGEKGLMQTIVEAGDAAVAAVIACSADAEDDTEFYAWLLTAPDDVVLDLMKFAVRMTFRDEDPSVFFLKLVARLEALGLFKAAPETEAA
ncbi:hypothetical protein [Gellertiella hungarica]|uniref:Uncharacterized protein n=1 Tax=Gellertiella hungarica TaxID=1572859 RepID=A0A7W6J537_9HYPH|nr:hypothetical protein [Gellertiella hungarica]MBB4064053.1 hypothetical protein [Gellertiella hungarica]